MIALRSLFVVLAIVSTCVAADPRGFFVSVGGGLTRVKLGSYSVSASYLTNSVPEVLELTDRSDTVSTVQLGGGYRWGPHWALQVQYARSGTAEATMALPRFPGIISIVPLPWYERNVLRYESERLGIIPSYSIPLSTNFGVQLGAGLTRTRTRSHNEVTFKQWLPEETRTVRSATQGTNDWSYIALLALEYHIAEHWTLSASADYAPSRTKTIGPIVPFGRSKPSKDSVTTDAWSANLSLTWQL